MQQFYGEIFGYFETFTENQNRIKGFGHTNDPDFDGLIKTTFAVLRGELYVWGKSLTSGIFIFGDVCVDPAAKKIGTDA